MPATGPLPRFAEVHVRVTLEIIAENNRIGRKELVRRLGIGEGSVRTILNKLKVQGLITSSRGGHTITAKGKRLISKPHELVQVDVGDLTVGKINVATIVRGVAKKVKRGIEQRDEAIKAGAQGATVLVFKRGKLQFPDGFLDVDEEVSNTLTKIFEPRQGDVIVIGTAGDVVKAEVGARAAARILTTKASRI